MVDYNKYKPHLQVLWTLGQGIMIAPHLIEILSYYKVAPKSSLYRHLVRLEELGLVHTINVEKVKILYISQAGVDLIGADTKIVINRVANTSSLNRSMQMIQYIISYKLQNYKTLDSLLTNLNKVSNIVAKRDSDVLAAILNANKDKALKNNGSLDYNYFIAEYNYIKYIEDKRLGNLKGLDIKPPSAQPKPHIGNLKSRGIYINSCRPGAEYGIDLKLIYFEKNDKLISQENFYLDMETLTKWLDRFPTSDYIVLDIIVKPHRLKAVEQIVKKHFSKNRNPYNIQVNVIEMETAINTYFKTTSISIELNEEHIERSQRNNLPTLKEINARMGNDELLKDILG